jgi:hypothetical protein
VNDAFVFLVLILVAAVIVFAVISAAKPRGRRGSGGYGGNRSSSGPTMTRAEIAARWATITAMAGPAGGGNGLRQAVLEADKLLDQALRQSGLPGATMGDRLKAARPRFAADRAAYDRLWRAHKLRNALAHEVGFDLVPSQAREALRDFESALRTLGAF